MLSIPKHGWVNITIGSWTDRASYLSDVHYDLLDAITAKLKNWRPTCVNMDAEGWEYIIVFDRFNTHIIEYKDDMEYYSFEIPVSTLANELYTDISEHLYEWSLWDYDAKNEEVRVNNERILREKLELLKQAMEGKN